MNAKLETPTLPNATSAHDATLRDIAARYQAIGKAILEAIELHHGDCADRLGELQDELQYEYLRLGGAREVAYELANPAGLPDPDEAENAWLARHGSRP